MEKEKMKIYISGKITGDSNYYKKFLDAENRLYEAGFEPVNPAALAPANADWNKAMRTVVGVMLKCDGIALLPDWKGSRGAVIEERLARDVGLPVKPLAEWLAGRAGQ